MFFLLLILIAIPNDARAMEENLPFYAIDRAMLISRKYNGKIIILPQADCFEERDFTKTSSELITVVQRRLRKYNDFMQRCTKEIFCLHHGNLLIHAVNQQSPDLVKELLQVPDIKTKRLYWKEIDLAGQEKEMSGTIRDYVKLCTHEGSNDVAALHKCWQLVQNIQIKAANSSE